MFGPPYLDPVTLAGNGVAGGALWPAWLSDGVNGSFLTTPTGLRGSAEGWWMAMLFHRSGSDGAIKYLFSAGNSAANGISVYVSAANVFTLRVWDDDGTPSLCETSALLSSDPGWHLAIMQSDGAEIRLDLDGVAPTPVTCVGLTAGVGAMALLSRSAGAAATVVNQIGAFFGSDTSDLTPAHELVVKAIAHQGPDAVAAWLASYAGGGEPLAPTIDHGWVAHNLADIVGADDLTALGVVTDVFYDPTPVFW